MAASNHIIAPVESSDLPFLARLVHAAKLSLSINRLLYQPWPNEDVQKKQYTGAVEGGFADSSMECFKATDSVSNDIVGYIVFTRKQAVHMEEEEPAPTIASSASEQNNNNKTPKGINAGLLSEISNAAAQLAKATASIERYGKVFLFSSFLLVLFCPLERFC